MMRCRESLVNHFVVFFLWHYKSGARPLARSAVTPLLQYVDFQSQRKVLLALRAVASQGAVVL